MSAINHPKHYQVASELTRPVLSLLIPESMLDMECIEVIEQLNLGSHASHVLKYLWRAGLKSDRVVEDLNKALWYLDRCHDRGHLCGLGNIAKAQKMLHELIAQVEA